MGAFRWIAMNVVVTEQPLSRRFLVAPCQADDDDVNVGHSPCVTSPCKRAVRKADLKSVPFKKNWPELCHLFPLRDGAGSDEANFGE